MSEKEKPLKPEDVLGKKEENFPEEVIISFNELISQNFRNGYASFKQEEVVKLMIKKGLNRDEIFEKHWLDVEGVYRKEGWGVYYDAPGPGESYDATFKFSTTKKQ